MYLLMIHWLHGQASVLVTVMLNTTVSPSSGVVLSTVFTVTRFAFLSTKILAFKSSPTVVGSVWSADAAVVEFVIVTVAADRLNGNRTIPITSITAPNIFVNLVFIILPSIYKIFSPKVYNSQLTRRSFSAFMSEDKIRGFPSLPFDEVWLFLLK